MLNFFLRLRSESQIVKNGLVVFFFRLYFMEAANQSNKYSKIIFSASFGCIVYVGYVLCHLMIIIPFCFNRSPPQLVRDRRVSYSA